MAPITPQTGAITSREAEQVERANASGKTPVVFIHGLWLLPSSWDRWAGVFERAGYAAVTPSSPDDPETIEEAREHPEVFARKTLGQIGDHVAEVIQALTKKPVVMGHSTGGLLAQMMADRGPLLIIDGEVDHTVPWAIANASDKRQRRNPGVTEIVKVPNRGHSLTIDSGWREVADTALRFVQRFT
jgi:pimeloyl-ACP methyl ester carboxylesterase